MMEIYILQIYISLYSLPNVTHVFLLLKEIRSLFLQAPATSYFIASFENAQRASLFEINILKHCQRFNYINQSIS